MRILITGSSGTIGTRLFEQLLPHHEVIGVDNRQNRWHPYLNDHTINADLRKDGEVSSLPKNIDLVIHLAANARVYELVKEPRLALDNMLINFNVLEFMRENGISKMLFASSRETYGNIKAQGAISEEMARIENCESPYSASKVTGEALTRAYSKVYGLEFTIARFSNVYGMYDDSDRVIPLWIRQTLKGDDLIVYGQDKVLDFTYIDDAIDGIIRMIDWFDNVRGNTVNIAYGEGISLVSVAQRIRELLKANNEIVIEESRPGEVWRFEADLLKAKTLLDYQPKVGIEDGLKRTVDWYQGFYRPSNRGKDYASGTVQFSSYK